jgi:hypothetical protein
LIGRRQHANVLDVQSFIEAECAAEHCLVVTEIRERLALSKQGMHRFHMERFNLKKLYEIDGKEQYCA